jgi:hypothetical protein
MSSIRTGFVLALTLAACSSEDGKGEQNQDPSTGLDAATSDAATRDAAPATSDARVIPTPPDAASVREGAGALADGAVATVDAGVDAGSVRSGPVTGLLRLVDFETGAFQKGTAAHDGVLTTYANCSSSKPTVVDPDFAYGNHALRVAVPTSALAKGGCFTDSGYLNIGVEVLGKRNESVDMRADETYWIGFAVYLPADFKSPKDDDWHVLMLHDLAGKTVYSSIFIALNTDLSWRVGHDGAILDGHTDKKFGRAVTGQWQEFVIKFVPAYDASKGKLQLWHRVRGEAFAEIDNYTGRTVAAADQFPNYVNLAAFHWATSNGDTMDPRVFFYDELRVGDHRVSFDDVVPGAKTTPP